MKCHMAFIVPILAPVLAKTIQPRDQRTHIPGTSTHLQGGRQHFIGGSDARIIMGGDEAALTRLWQEKRGEAARSIYPANLSSSWAWRPRSSTALWYERQSGHRVSQRQARKFHPSIVWMAATLDGLVEQTGAVFEAKFMLPWSFSEEAAAEKHMAQLQHNMMVAGIEAGGALDHHRRRQMG